MGSILTMVRPFEAAQVWDADRYGEHAGFVPELGQSVLDLLQVRRGERILDLGCGDGVLTEKIAAMGAEVVGVDGSSSMVAAATARGVNASLADASSLTFSDEFDAVFSNAALHWMKEDPGAVIAGVKRALKPAGRFVGEMGGHGNVAAIVVAILNTLDRRGVQNPASRIPWYFPTADEYRLELEGCGFSVEYIELMPRPTPLPTGMAAWIETFGMSLIGIIPEAEHADAIAEVVKSLRPVLCDGAGRWTADYVRLRFTARAQP
jgi:ubiquinone/menaquinone biosynthesis C-methylase UbiE